MKTPPWTTLGSPPTSWETLVQTISVPLTCWYQLCVLSLPLFHGLHRLITRMTPLPLNGPIVLLLPFINPWCIVTQALDDNDENNTTLWTAESLSWLSSLTLEKHLPPLLKAQPHVGDVCIAIFVYSVSRIETGVAATLRNVFSLRSTLRRRRFVIEDLWAAHDMICRRYFARDCRIYFLHERHYYFLIEPRSTKRKCALKFAFSYTGMWIVNSRLAKHDLNSTNSFCRVLYFVIRAILLAVAECTDVHVFSALCVQTNEIVQPCFSMTIFYRNSTTICK